MTNIHSIPCGVQLYGKELSDLMDMDIDDEEDLDFIFDDDEEVYEWASTTGEPRRKRWEHTRLNWSLHVAKLIHERAFSREYRMSIDTFTKLSEILTPELTRQSSKSSSPDPISVEIIMAIGLRWLAGGKVNDLKHVVSMSRAAVYKCRDDFLDAILSCAELSIDMPKNDEEWEAVRKGFAAKSTDGLFHGCCGAIDGFFQGCQAFTVKDCGGNVIAYFSGHYKSYGVNVQAACDSRLRFLYFGVVAPGKTNDNVAFNRTGTLKDIIANLPPGLYFVGDAAYTLSEHLLIPCIGPQRANANNDAFNYYLSQLRIRIEMSFGRLTSKWCILRTKLQTNLENTSKILMACARLHNFVIDEEHPEVEVEDEEDDEDDDDDDGRTIRPMPNSPLGMTYLPTIPEDFEEIEGVSHARASLVEQIREKNYWRPFHNIARNKPASVEGVGTVPGYGAVAGIDQEFYHPE